MLTLLREENHHYVTVTVIEILSYLRCQKNVLTKLTSDSVTS